MSQILMVTEIQPIRSNQLIIKNRNVKKCRIQKIFSFSERGSLTENNGTITNVQLLIIMEKFNFFKNFNYLLMGGHNEKVKNFGKSKKNR